jgi:hypothetical protein
METSRNRTEERGSTMVIVALLVAAVAMLSLTLLSTLRSSQQENQGSRESLSALYACEAGLSAGVRSLATGGSGDLGSQNAPVAFGEQSYWVVSTPMGDGRTSLRSVGRDDGARMGVEVVVQPDPSGFFRWAAFGEELLHMDANSRTDSYDSTVNPGSSSYSSQQVNGSGSNAYANTDGDVGSNGNITMDSNIGVWGDAHPGPSGTVTGSQSGDPNISGSTTPLATSVELPDVIVPSITSSGPYMPLGNTILSSGSYHFTDLQVYTNKTMTIHGPATVVCDNFKLKSGASLVVDATDGPVKFYVINDFVLNSNTQVYSTTYSPLDVAFNLLSDNILDPGIDVTFDEDLVDFDSGSKLYGTIFAPSAEVTIDSNFEQFGSLVARRSYLYSDARIHYDERLATVSQEGQNVFTTLCWRVVPVP